MVLNPAFHNVKVALDSVDRDVLPQGLPLNCVRGIQSAFSVVVCR